MPEQYEVTTEEARTRMLAGIVADQVGQQLGDIIEAAAQAKTHEDRGGDQAALVKALCAARKKFEKVEAARTAEVVTKPKGDRPAGKYSYNYASLADVIDATGEALADAGLAIFQGFQQQNGGSITIVTELAHEAGGWRKSWLAMPVPQGAGPQEIAGSITYGRRYSRLAMLDLAPSEDDDAAGAQTRVQSQQQRGKSPDEIVALRDADPAAAFAEARKLVDAKKSAANAISEPKLMRLVAIARESGWNERNIDLACSDHLGVRAAEIPWQAYDLVVELFRGLPLSKLPTVEQAARARAPRSGDPREQAIAALDGALADGEAERSLAERHGPELEGIAPEPAAAEEPAPPASAAPKPVTLDEPPLSADEAWGGIAKALAARRPEERTAITPEQRLDLFKPALNGQACPVQKAGQQEALLQVSRAMESGAKGKFIGEVLHALERDGVISEEDVKHSNGADKPATRQDAIAALELARVRLVRGAVNA
jgi:hypothetical protein